MSSPISTILANLRRTVNILRSAVYAIDVRDDIADAIDDSADAIEQIYSDVDSASLREDAFAAALQEAIDDNLLPIPATVIDDNSLPGTKIQNASIPLSKLAEPVQITVDGALSASSTNPVQNKVIKGAIDELNGSLGWIPDYLPAKVEYYESGRFNKSTGTKTVDSKHLRSLDFLPEYVSGIGTTSQDYKIDLWAWNGDTFVGRWNGTEFIKGDANTGETSIDIFSLTQTYPNYSYKISLFRTDSANIDETESINISYFMRLDWENVTYAGADGTASTNNKWLSTIYYIPDRVKYVDMLTGYKCVAHAWNADGTYAGRWTGTDLLISSSARIRLSYVDVSAIKTLYPNVKIKISMIKDSETQISVSESENAKVYVKIADDYTLEGYIQGCLEAFEEGQMSVPDYWVLHIKSKINSVLTKMQSIGQRFECFIFITDLHYPDFNYGKSPSLIKYILDNSPIRNVVIGGDVIHNQTDAISKYNDLHSKFKSTGGRIFAIRGNHDNGSDGIFYAIWQKELEEFIDTGGSSDFYYDNPSQKIRYIFLDTTNPNSGLTTQKLNWTRDKIEELESGWAVLIFVHDIWDNAQGGGTYVTNDGVALKGLLDEIYDSVDADIIGIVSGHTHGDYNETTSKGYQIMATTCDANGAMASYDPENPTRTNNTITGQAFDIYIIDFLNRKIFTYRIGVGNDREFTF